MASQELQIPKHVAFIMDGNGRWAKKRFMPRTYGHRKGVKALKRTIRALDELGVEYATFYAFSTENWKRPADEVTELMKIFDEQLDGLVQYENENIRLRFIGDRDGLPQTLRDKMKHYEELSENRTGLTVTIAINYGGHDELCRAAKKMLLSAKDGFISESDITPELYKSFLDTGDMPNVDLMIRTGGEIRISNFLLWQIAYAELYFCDTLWPDFGKSELIKAVTEYSRRDRRFGRIK